MSAWVSVFGPDYWSASPDNWDGEKYAGITGGIAFEVLGAWATGLRPTSVRMTIDITELPTFTNLNFDINSMPGGGDFIQAQWISPDMSGPAPHITVGNNVLVVDLSSLYFDIAELLLNPNFNSPTFNVTNVEFFTDWTPPSTAPICESITLASSALTTASPDAVLTIVFDSAVAGLAAANINAPHCTITEPLSSDSGVTWVATVSAVAGVVDVTNQVSLDFTGITNGSGVTAVGLNHSDNYTVNTATETTNVDFQKISSSLRVPGAYIEIDGSQAGLNSGSLPNLLLVGQKLSTGTAAAGEICLIGSLADAVAKAGAGSMLAQMAKRYFAIAPVMNLYMLPFADNTLGSAATATLDVTAAATVGGTLSLYIGGTLVTIAVTATMTTTAIATALAAAINALDDATNHSLPARADVDGTGVILTARHFGTCGNAIDVRLNALPTDVMPTGLVIDVTGFSGGTLIPTAISTDNIAAIFDDDDSGYLYAPSKYVALGLSDDVTLAAFHAESQRRYAPPIQSGFRAFATFSGGYTDAIDFGNTKNYEHICCVAINGGLTTTWETAAIVASTAAPAMYDNPVRSLEGTALKGLVMAKPYTFVQANSLLYAGLSILQKSRDGSCSIKRLISMYLHRADDSADDAYLDINTTEVMERIRYEQRMGAIQRFTGMACAKNDEGYRPGLPIITVDTVRAYLLTLYKERLLATLGWVQEYQYYKSTLIIEQDPVNPSRFNYTDTPVILSPFYILAGRAQFRKEVG